MLEKKQVGNYIVSQAGMFHAIRRMRMLQAVMDAQEKKLYDDDTLEGLKVYPNIAAAIDNINMTIEDYRQTPEIVLDELTTASMELNPHWYGIVNNEKKTNTLQPESTNA